MDVDGPVAEVTVRVCRGCHDAHSTNLPCHLPCNLPGAAQSKDPLALGGAQPCPGKRPAGARKVSWGQGQLVARHRSCGQVHGCLRRRRGMGSCGLWRVPVCKVVPRGDHVRPLLKRSEGGRRSRRQAQARGRRRRPRTARCPIAKMLPVGCGRVFAAAAFSK